MMTTAPVYSSAYVRSLPSAQKQAFLSSLSDDEAAALYFDWYGFWARANQHPPGGDWTIWLLLAGRGFGKTRTEVEWARAQIETGRCRRLALVGRTAADVRDVLVEGESGILACSPPAFRPTWEPSRRRLTWPNGAIATTYSAEEPDSLRGPQHDGAVADELAAWAAPEAWSNLMFGLRLGTRPRAVAATTPKRVALVKELLTRPGVVVTRGTTYENLANLAPTFVEQVVQPYEGTRLGRQELNAELLEDNPGALWKRQTLEDLRVTQAPDLVRIVVAIDPAATSGEGADDTGLVVMGLGVDKHLYLLEDATMHGTPAAWALQALACYHKWQADRLVGESNNGGEMVEHTLKSMQRGDGRAVAYKAVHASRGKRVRAEPIAALYEKGQAHHVGTFPLLEDELCQWETGMASPNRLDALVWAATELLSRPALAVA